MRFRPSGQYLHLTLSGFLQIWQLYDQICTFKQYATLTQYGRVHVRRRNSNTFFLSAIKFCAPLPRNLLKRPNLHWKELSKLLWIKMIAVLHSHNVAWRMFALQTTWPRCISANSTVYVIVISVLFHPKLSLFSFLYIVFLAFFDHFVAVQN